MKKPIRLMIIAGEPSGDLHGSHLAQALFKADRSLEITGIGGTEMATAGVDIFFDMKEIAVVGIVEVLSHFNTILKAFSLAKGRILNNYCDAVILIDYPDFNLRLARIARRKGLPTFYYISPQVWAWRKGRIRQIARDIDKMLVILPFEKKFYDAHGVNCSFVGHPLLDETEKSTPQTVEQIKKHNKPIISLFPGSRKSETKRLLGPMIESAIILKKKFPTASFIISQASTIEGDDINVLLEKFKHEINRLSMKISVIQNSPITILENSDLAIVASGTITLQGAIANTPMVVIYRLSPLTFLIGRLLVKIKHIALANLIADKRVVPELIQGEASPENIADEAAQILSNESRKIEIKKGLAEAAKRLGGPGCSKLATGIILDFLKQT